MVKHFMIGALSAVAVLATPASAEKPKSVNAARATPELGSDAVVPLGAKPELLWEGGTWLEGPAVAATGEVYFSDIIEVWHRGKLGVIRMYDPKTRQGRMFQSPSFGSNGLAFDAQGRMIAARAAAYGARAITRTDMTTNLSEVVAGLYNGRALNGPNDIAFDPSGRIYFTDPRYGGHEPIEQPVTGVYRIDPDGSVHRIISDLFNPNGLAISLDGKRLFVVEADGLNDPFPGDAPNRPPSGRVRLYVYDLATDGTVSNRKMITDYAERKTQVDGIKTDRDGNLWVTEMSDNPGIRVLTPSYKTLGFIKTPEIPINLTFARTDGVDWLYFTTPKRLYRIRVSIPGV